MASKKVMAILLALTLIASLVMAMPVVSMAAENALAVCDVEFTKDGENIYTICDGNIGANIYMSNNSAIAETVYASVTRYVGNRLSEISFTQKTVPAKSVRTKVSVAPIATTTQTGYNVLLWDGNMNPITNEIALTDKSAAKKITKFQVGVGTYTYNADINEETKEITIFVPTRYMANYEGIGYVDKTGEDHGLVNTKTNLTRAISAGITPVIEGLGTISGVGVAKDFSKPVEYTVTAEDGSSVVYTAKIVENDSKMFHKPGTSRIASNGLPHPRDGWRVKNSGQAEPNGNYAWLDTGHTATASMVEGSSSYKVFQLAKTNAAVNDTFYLYAPNKPAVWGYQQTQIAEVTMSLSNLTEGNGFAISYFEKEGYANKNANLIFKKVAGEDKMELYWSRGGLGYPTKIDTVAPIALGEMHTYRVVRTMNPDKLSTGKFAGNIALYVDGKYAFSVTETNFLSFNGIENGSDHNGAYSMMVFGSVTNDTAENGGVTYTLTVDEIKYQTALYDEALLSTDVNVKASAITIDGKEYKPYEKDGKYSYIVPSDADLTNATLPEFTAVSKYANVTVEGSLADAEGPVVTVTNSLTGASETHTGLVKANKMTHMVFADFNTDTLEEAVPEGYTQTVGQTTLVEDPTNALNKALRIEKNNKNYNGYYMLGKTTPVVTNGYATSFDIMFNSTSGSSGYPIFSAYAIGVNGPSFDIYRGDNSTYGMFGYRSTRERIDADLNYDNTNVGMIKADNGAGNFAAMFNKWYNVTYILVPSNDLEAHPYGYYFDMYVDRVYKATYTGPIGQGDKKAPGALTANHLKLGTPFTIQSYGGFGSNGVIYIDNVDLYYTAQ